MGEHTILWEFVGWSGICQRGYVEEDEKLHDYS